MGMRTRRQTKHLLTDTYTSHTVTNLLGVCAAMTQPPPPCDRFHNNLLCMKDPILSAISQCKSSLISSDLVEAAFAFLTIMNHQDLLDTFIKRTHQHWELIAMSKDVTPILDSVLGGFEELGKERIAEIQRVVKDKEVNNEVQAQILILGKSLVKIAIRHLQATGSTIVNVGLMARLYDLDLTGGTAAKK